MENIVITSLLFLGISLISGFIAGIFEYFGKTDKSFIIATAYVIFILMCLGLDYGLELIQLFKSQIDLEIKEVLDLIRMVVLGYMFNMISLFIADGIFPDTSMSKFRLSLVPYLLTFIVMCCIVFMLPRWLTKGILKMLIEIKE